MYFCRLFRLSKVIDFFTPPSIKVDYFQKDDAIFTNDLQIIYKLTSVGV